MKTLIYFNAPDKPENMGQSQLVDNVQSFINERSDILIDASIQEDNIMTFTTFDENGNPGLGYAILVQVPDNFQN